MVRLIFALLLIATPGHAALCDLAFTLPCTLGGVPDTKWGSCTPWHKMGVESNSIKIGDSLCYDFDDTQDSVPLAVSHCENIDVLFQEDIEGTASTGETQIKSVLMIEEASAGDASFILENVTLTGDETADEEAIYGMSSPWIYVDPSTDPAGEDARVLVRCK